MKLPMILAIGSIAATLAAAPVSPVLSTVGSGTQQPITPVADVTHVLVSAPWGIPAPSPAEPFGIYDVTNGNAHFAHFANQTPPYESSIAISPGLPGFPPGWVYAVYPNGSGGLAIGAVPPSGIGASTIPATPCANPATVPCTLVANLPIDADHIGNTFDQVGTFGNKLIVLTTEKGGSHLTKMFFVSSNGAFTSVDLTAALPATLSSCPGPVCPDYFAAESPRVAPASFGALGGQVWFPARDVDETRGVILAYDGSTVTTVHTFGTDVGSPDSLAFPNLSNCKNGGDFFLAEFSNNKVVSFTGEPGSAYVNIETNTQSLWQVVPSGSGYNFFQVLSGMGQTEHMNSITPRSDRPCATVCALTQGGYKNHFNSLVLNFPPGGLFLGTNFYTNADLNAILQNNAVGGNGLISLAHQLITAELNLFYGAVPSGANLTTLLNAITQANSLIGNKLIPPLGSGFLLPSVSSGTESTLDNYNEGTLGVCSR
jgi:hypothetical protein